MVVRCDYSKRNIQTKTVGASEKNDNGSQKTMGEGQQKLFKLKKQRQKEKETSQTKVLHGSTGSKDSLRGEFKGQPRLR